MNSPIFSAVLDAEKLLLDELKKENGQLRTKLSSAESDITTLAGKLASLADDNSAFEKKVGMFVAFKLCYFMDKVLMALDYSYKFLYYIQYDFLDCVNDKRS